jgi:acyl dehydratase
MDSAQRHRYADLAEGQTHDHDYVITPAVYDNFLVAFADHSPLHMDAAHARAAGFADRVMHGGILHGFVSHFVGMIFPGAGSLLLSSELRFQKPNYLGDQLRLTAKLAQKLDVQQVIVLHLAFFNQTQNHLAASGRVQVQVRAL